MQDHEERVIRLTDADDGRILEDIGIVQGTVIHLQDARSVSRAKYNKGEIDWTKMTSQPASQKPGGEPRAQIDSSSASG